MLELELQDKPDAALMSCYPLSRVLSRYAVTAFDVVKTTYSLECTIAAIAIGIENAIRFLDIDVRYARLGVCRQAHD